MGEVGIGYDETIATHEPIEAGIDAVRARTVVRILEDHLGSHVAHMGGVMALVVESAPPRGCRVAAIRAARSLPRASPLNRPPRRDAGTQRRKRKVERSVSEQYLEAWTEGGARADDRPPSPALQFGNPQARPR